MKRQARAEGVKKEILGGNGKLVKSQTAQDKHDVPITLKLLELR